MKKNSKKKNFLILFAVLTVILISGTGYYLLKSGHKGRGSSADSLTAPVLAVKAYNGMLSREMTFYGNVIGSPAGIRKISLNFEAVIKNIYVLPGERVRKGELLFEAIPSAHSELAINEAKNAYKAAKKNLSFVKQKYSMRVATRQDISNAKNAYNKARIKYLNMLKYFNPKVYSPISGVIDNLFCSRGSIVPAGKLLAKVVGVKSLIIKCGSEPGNVKYLKRGQSADIIFSGYTYIVKGKILQVSGKVDGKSGLVDFYVIPEAGKKVFPVLPGSVAKVQVNGANIKGLIVPATSLLQERRKYYVYLVKKDRAEKVYIEVLLQNDISAVVKGNLKNGDMIVSGGGYELSPGMKVRIINKNGIAR